MPDISITVTDKRPVCTAGTTVVCDNSDYIVHWDLDEEWSAYDSKTMRVIYMDSTYADTVFSGDSVALPPVPVPGCVQIGLYAGDIHTSRMAFLRALSSVRSASGAPANPTPDVYDQLMERMAQLENPDWNQNDPTAKGHVKNRTHYVSRESVVIVPEQEVTTAEQNNLNVAVLNDVDSNAIQTLYSSEDDTTFDVVFDGTSYQCKWLLGPDGDRVPAFGNLTLFNPSSTDTGEPFVVLCGSTGGTHRIVCKVAGTHTVAVSIRQDVVHTLDPKYIKDMYYSEVAETVIGYGMDGWAVTTKNEAVSIPKMAIKGKVYENVPVDHTQMANVVYIVGGYTLSFNRMNYYMTADPSDLSDADVAFYGEGTVYHRLPTWAINLGGQGIYVADASGPPTVRLDKMPEDCRFVVAINLSRSFTVNTVHYRGEDAPIISCKTGKQITNNAVPSYAMLLALTADGWICVNPIA
jgi:hypothetical protein